jgi:hypothetical protein
MQYSCSYMKQRRYLFFEPASCDSMATLLVAVDCEGSTALYAAQWITNKSVLHVCMYPVPLTQ